MTADQPLWMLGFVESAAPSALLRHHFPSKVGGRPAWLDPVDLPTEDQLSCPLTGGLRNFLLQIYAPVFEIPDAFHRTVFLFVSPKGNEVTGVGGVCAFRSQLPRSNPFYSPMPPSPLDRAPISLPENYVVKDPWKVADYEQSLAGGGENIEVLGGLHLFPEKNLSVAEELSESEYVSELDQPDLSPEESPVITEEDISTAERLLSREQSDFIDFQDHLRKSPSQCVRYCFEEGVEPLWPNRQQPTIQLEEIPNCERCGAPRRFEFQVLPQLLNHLDQNPLEPDSYDWGTIVVYSCSKSCSPGDHPAVGGKSVSRAYVPEFVFVQPM